MQNGMGMQGNGMQRPMQGGMGAPMNNMAQPLQSNGMGGPMNGMNQMQTNMQPMDGGTPR